LALASGEPPPGFADLRGIAIRQVDDELMNAGRLGRDDDLVV